MPTIEKLRKERGEYMKWAVANDTLERLRRFCVAYEFTRAEEAVKEAAAGAEELAEKIAAKLERVEDAKAAAVEKAEEAERVRLQLEAQLGGEVKQLTANADALSKDLVRATSEWSNVQDSLKSEKKSGEKLRKSLKESEAAEASREAKVAKITADAEETEAALAAAVAAEDFAGKTLAGVESGQGGADKSLQTQLAEAITLAEASDANAKAAAIKIKHVEKELAANKKSLGAKEKEAAKINAELAAAELAVTTARAAIANHSGADAAAATAAEERKSGCETEFLRLQETVDILKAQLDGLDFKYKDPEAKFDRRKVKGYERAATSRVHVLSFSLS